MKGWLTGNLPRVLADDPVLCAVAEIAEHIADTYRDRVDGIEEHLDAAAASGPMLRYLASWLDADLDPEISPDRQREVVQAVGTVIAWRGTRRGLRGLVEALTGSRVQVSDSGGVWADRETVPDSAPEVIVDIDDLGELRPSELFAYLRKELPVGVRVTARRRGEPLGVGGPA